MEWIIHSPCEPGVGGSITGFPNLSDKTLKSFTTLHTYILWYWLKRVLVCVILLSMLSVPVLSCTLGASKHDFFFRNDSSSRTDKKTVILITFVSTSYVLQNQCFHIHQTYMI